MNDLNRKSQINILLLTGRSAANLVEKYTSKQIAVFVLPMNVAAFISNSSIKKHLPKKTVSKFDIVITPGLVKDDLSELESYFKIPFVKGPRYISDLQMVLDEIDPFELSTKHPADKFLKEKKLERSKSQLEDGYNRKLDLKAGEYSIGKKHQFFIGLERPPIVMAEIVDATKLSMKQIEERARYYLDNGAQIIDIGAVANYSKPDKVAQIIDELQELKNQYEFAVSIDTLDGPEIISAIDSGVELILSIDHSNINFLLDKIPNDIGVVYVPTDVKKGYLSREPEERIASLLKLKELLIDAGFTKLAADPIIEMPIYPGFTKSLNYYYQYRQVDPITPMMTCVGNVTEFIAADAIGINALFSSIAVELGIQFILATDVSAKCRGGIKEIVQSRDMAYIAKMNNAPPKGHGFNVLMAKSRTVIDVDLSVLNEKEIIKLPNSSEKSIYSLDYEPDPKGSFTIWIDYHKQLIYVTHLESKTNAPTITIQGSNARVIFEEIIQRKLLSKIDHAYYMGRELERAEICLYLGKSYIQNQQTFK